MNGIWKKIAALVLVMCLVISVLPPVASATDTDTGTEAETTIYDFCLENSSLKTNAGGNFSGAFVNDAAITTHYNNGDLNWRYHTRSASYTGKFGAAGKWKGVYFYGASQGYWTSFLLRAPAAGEYDLTLNIQQSASGSTNGKIWILPGSQTTATISAAVTEQEPLFNTVDYKGGVTAASTYKDASLSGHITVGDETVLTMVMQVPDTRYMHLVSLVATLVEAAPEESTPEESTPEESTPEESTPEVTPNPDKDAFVNFHLNGDSDFTWDNGGVPTNFDGQGAYAQRATISNLYTNKKLNWYYHTHSSGSGTQFGADGKWNGLRIYNNNAGEGYVTLKMRSPGEGEYNLKLNFQKNKVGGLGALYILSGSLAANEVAAAIANAKPVITFDCSSQGSTYEDAFENLTYTFGTNATYTLAFKYNNKEGGTSGNLFVRSLEAEAVPVVEPTFDFTEIEAAHGKTLTGSNSCPDIRTAYINGTINWQFWHAKDHSESQMGGDGNIWSGLKFGAKAGTTTGYGFAAYYIKPAETGNYTVTAHYQTHSDLNGEVNVYIIPGSTPSANVGKVAVASDAVGSYSCNSDRAEYVNAKKTLDNEVLLVGGTQYVVVFLINNATENAVTGTIKGLTLTRNNVLKVGDEPYATLKEAAAAAEKTDDKLVTLTGDATVGGEYALPVGVTVDLNGHKLESAGELVTVAANIVDSSEGNNGLLVRISGNITFDAENVDLPVWDYKNKAYSFFDYKLESNDDSEAVGNSEARQKFWFKFHFYTNDDCTTLDQDAYALVKQGYSGFGIGAMLTWNGEELDPVNFGIPDEEGNNNTTMFAQSWATFYEKDEETGKYTDVEIAPHDGRWLYLVVSGLGGDMVGELTVKPVIAASGVEINGETMSYTAAG